MDPANPMTLILQVDGSIQMVDTVNRDLQMRSERKLLIVNVPPDCPVILNHEAVKLRLLQPADRVRVFYRVDRDGLLTACRIEARGGSVPGEAN